jgi:hypothetical protein
MGHIRSEETVASALRESDAGMSDAANAAKHGVAIKTIRRWRREYQRRDRPRGQTHLLARCPRCQGGTLDASAYAELLGWYLGDGHISLGRRGVYALHIFNDAKYLVLNTHLIELMRRVKPECRPHTRPMTGAVNTTVSWKHWPCLFPQHGPGRKHERRLRVEEWQQDIVQAHLADFLRGALPLRRMPGRHGVTRIVAGERKRYDYPRWQFVNHSDDIRRFCTDALDLLEIPWRRSNRYCVSVSTRAGVALLGLKR